MRNADTLFHKLTDRFPVTTSVGWGDAARRALRVEGGAAPCRECGGKRAGEASRSLRHREAAGAVRPECEADKVGWWLHLDSN